MANTVLKYWYDPQETAYLDDFGTQQVFNPVVRIPSDITTEQGATILTCLGAVEREEPVPCTNQQFTPRKLTFRRRNGNSFSLAVNANDDLKTVAQCIIDIFKATDFPVICVEYIGERWQNIYDRFNVNAEASTPTQPIRPSEDAAKNAAYYKGYMLEYETESGQTYQQVRSLPFKSQTRVNDEVLTELTAYFGSCVGEIAGSFCATSRYIEYRRFVVGFLTTGGSGALNQDENIIQTVTVPSKSPSAESLTDCASTLVQIASVACLEYVGETNSRFHLEGLNLDV